MRLRKWITVAAGTGVMSLAAAMPAAAAGTMPITGVGAGSENHRHVDADGQNPGMMRMHELMKDGNPGMMRMHENMMGTATMMSAKSVAGSAEGELR